MGNLPAALGQVDVREIEDDDKGQGSGEAHYEPDDIVEAGERAVHAVPGGAQAGNSVYALEAGQGPGQGLLVPDGLEQGRVGRPLTIGRGGDYDVISQVVVKYSADGDGERTAVRVPQRKAVVNAQSQPLRHGIAHHGLACAGEGHALPAGAKLPVPVHALCVLKYVEADGARRVRGVNVHAVHGGQCDPRHAVKTRKPVSYLAAVAGEPGLHAVGLHIFVLQRARVYHGVAHAEAGDQQGRAAADAHQHHDQALLVAEHIAQRDLLQESKPPPQRRDALQEDALSLPGRARAQQPAGTPASSLRQEMSVAPRMNASAARSVAAASVGLNT